MTPTKKAVKPLTKTKNNFVVNLSRKVYRQDVIDRAVAEDKDWVSKKSGSGKNYVSIELQTTDEQDALNWLNYLIYLHAN